MSLSCCVRPRRARLVAALIAGTVVFPPTALAQAIRVAATPILRLGASASQSELFNAVVGATRLPDGRIVVGDRGDAALLVFRADGSLERTLARKGKGPGEVTYLHWMYRCGNAIYTGDLDADRVQEFSLDLSYRRAFRFASQTYRLACNARGQFVHMGWDDNRSVRPGVHRANVRYWITGADTTAGVTLGMFPGSERFGTTNNGKLTGSGPLVLGREPRVAIGEQAAYLVTGDSLTVLAFDLSGKPRAPLAARTPVVASTAADVDAEIERQVAQLGETMRKPIEASLRQMPRPPSLPATYTLLVDATGLVWVQAYPRAGQPSVGWTVFRPNGTVAARLTLPASLHPFEIGRDYLLGQVINEETGLAEVHLYPLTR